MITCQGTSFEKQPTAVLRMETVQRRDAQIKQWPQVNQKIATTNDIIVSEPSNCMYAPQDERHPMIMNLLVYKKFRIIRILFDCVTFVKREFDNS